MGKKATIAAVAVSILTVVAWITAACIPKWINKRYQVAAIFSTQMEAGLWTINFHHNPPCDMNEVAKLEDKLKKNELGGTDQITAQAKVFLCRKEGDNDIGNLRDAFCATSSTFRGFIGQMGCTALTNAWYAMWIMLFVVVFSTVLQLIGNFFTFAYHAGGIKKGRHKKSYWRNAFLAYTISPVLSFIGLATYMYLTSYMGNLFGDNTITKVIANSGEGSGIHLSFGIALAATLFQLFPFCLMLGNKPHEKEDEEDDEEDEESMPFFFNAQAPMLPPGQMPGGMPVGVMQPQPGYKPPNPGMIR
eukprot:GDKI01038975.1.p1 GENE.GDKI01038975.1~~GDKI01038975.1.p1  ORF type:complete len:304 (-),score=121.24 GDKI01038975.1:254-1165(-)